MTRVAIVSHGYAPSLAGADVMARATARELAARGHRVVVLTALPGPADGLDPGVHFLDWRAVRDGTDELPWAPEIVHAFDLGRQQPHAFAAALARRHRIPLVLTPATAPEAWPDAAAARATLGAADTVLALTRSEAASLRARGADPHGILVIGNAADPPVPLGPDRLRRRLALFGQVVLFLGRRDPLKGAAHLLVAAGLARAAVPGLHLVLAGPGGPDLTAPGVTDLGLVNEADKADLLALCDVLCLPSRADVFPLVFIEAWSLAKPVISGDFAGARDVVRDGVDGLVVTVDPESVAAALVRLLTDQSLRAAMGTAGLERVRRELNWPALASRVEQAYAHAMSGGGPR